MRITPPLILLLGLLTLVPEARAQEVQKDDPIRINTTLVSVPVVASDRQGRYVAGLKQEEFALYQDGILQTISYFGTDEEPLNVALLLDTSRSTKDVLDKIKDAAKDFIKLLQPADQAMVMTFDFEVNVLSPLTSDRKRLEKAIKKVEIGERVGTVMRDAVLEAVEHDMAKVKGRKAIILLTDGKDYGSSVSMDALLDRLEESDVMVYSVYYQTMMGGPPGRGPMGQPGGMGRGRMGGMGIPPGGGGGGRGGGGRGGGPNGRPNGGPGGGPGAPDRQRRQNESAVEYLSEISEISAGRFYQKEVTDLKGTFLSIADELRQQYRLGFYPPDAETGAAVHNIKVKVSRDDVAVRSRRTYRTN
jgi:VWFA-related protein